MISAVRDRREHRDETDTKVRVSQQQKQTPFTHRSSFGTDETLAGTPSDASGHAGSAEVSRTKHPAPAQDAATNIGRYVVLRKLGQGGMGVVYSAYDPDLDRKIALKVVRDDLGMGTIGHNRIKQEAQAMARVAHPNVAHVYEVGEYLTPQGRNIFIAMEFIAGESLDAWQSKRDHHSAASLDECLRLYLQAAAGLAAAHASGLIHRDFKPSNVLIGQDGRVRVLDFGLARTLESHTLAVDEAKQIGTPANTQKSAQPRITMVGSILGTPGYMAPEQLLGQEVDARSDQFSFCAALYEAIYHRLPYGSDDLDDYADSILHAELRPPPGHTGSVEVPLVIKRALGKGLSIDPGERFPSLDALIAALTEALLPDAETQSIHRNKILLGAATTLSLALTTASVLWVYHDGKRSDLRINMQMAWIFASSIVVTIALFRKKILAQPRFRRVSQLILLLGGYLVVGRTIGVTQGYTAGPFLIQEMVGIALLFLAEVPAVGFRYLILPLLCLVSIALQIRFPEWRRIHLNIAYGVMTFLGAYWHLKGTPPEPR